MSFLVAEFDRQWNEARATATPAQAETVAKMEKFGWKMIAWKRDERGLRLHFVLKGTEAVVGHDGKMVRL